MKKLTHEEQRDLIAGFQFHLSVEDKRQFLDGMVSVKESVGLEDENGIPMRGRACRALRFVVEKDMEMVDLAHLAEGEVTLLRAPSWMIEKYDPGKHPFIQMAVEAMVVDEMEEDEEEDDEEDEGYMSPAPRRKRRIEEEEEADDEEDLGDNKVLQLLNKALIALEALEFGNSSLDMTIIEDAREELRTAVSWRLKVMNKKAKRKG
jgi:hypothetical protein